MVHFTLKMKLSILLHGALGDIFMHMPRGGNDRLNENGTGRANGNRLWDSQNNNQGGYNVGDTGEYPAANMGN